VTRPIATERCEAADVGEHPVAVHTPLVHVLDVTSAGRDQGMDIVG